MRPAWPCGSPRWRVGASRISFLPRSSTLRRGPVSTQRLPQDAIDVHILQLTPSGRGYIFRHALLAEAVYDDLLPGGAGPGYTHSRYAAVLAERGKIEWRPSWPATPSASHGLPDTAYRASVLAGEDAMSVAAPQEAMTHYESALELVTRMDSVPAGTEDVIGDLVEAAVAAGRSHRAVRHRGEGGASACGRCPNGSRRSSVRRCSPSPSPARRSAASWTRSRWPPPPLEAMRLLGKRPADHRVQGTPDRTARADGIRHGTRGGGRALRARGDGARHRDRQRRPLPRTVRLTLAHASKQRVGDPVEAAQAADGLGRGGPRLR